MEPSQLLLRSLKVIKESNKRLESNHCNKLEAQSTKKKINLEEPDGRRFGEWQNCRRAGAVGKALE